MPIVAAMASSHSPIIFQDTFQGWMRWFHLISSKIPQPEAVKQQDEACVTEWIARRQKAFGRLETALKTASFSDAHHQETVAEHTELFGAMAENYLIFRLLQGNPIVQAVGEPGSRAATHADLLGQFYAQSPIAAASQVAGKVDGEEDEGAQ